MTTIDSDAHVIECDETWDHLTAGERKFVQKVTVHDPEGNDRRGWVIDGRLRMASGGVIDEEAMTSAVREMSDVEGRLRQMDEIGTDIQVLYPTVFLSPLTSNPAVELALCRSWNRWLADRVAKSGGRLSWVVVPPTMNIEASIEEIRFGHEHGAGGVFWRGFENGMLPNDPYFAPILEEMDHLGMAMCIHAANGTPELHNSFPSDTGIWRFKIPGITAFHAILSSQLSTRYPNIRFGFIELQAQWVPYVLKDYIRRGENGDRRHARQVDPKSIMAEHRLYVACQSDDDLAYILSYAGPDNLLAGTDFGHADTSSELLALQRLRATPDVDSQALDNLLDANPRALYQFG